MQSGRPGNTGLTVSAPGSAVPVGRAFIRLAEGLVHYRHAGTDTAALPLYVAHAGPGSSRGLAPLIAEFGAFRRTIAPDMLGNGDSDPPARRDTDIAYYADCVVRVLDALEIEKVDFYGTHTGAFVGMALSAAHPDRLGKLVLDGVMLLDAAGRAKMLAHYAPEMVPDDFGGHLIWAYNFCRDMMLYYPYFERDAAHRTDRDLPPAAFIHDMVVDVLKALTTYHCAYRAAFAYDVEAAIRRLRHPVFLSCQSWDPLRHDLPRVADLMPAAELFLHPAGAGPAQVAGRVIAFLDKGA